MSIENIASYLIVDGDSTVAMASTPPATPPATSETKGCGWPSCAGIPILAMSLTC